jgi:hypothetical protein
MDSRHLCYQTKRRTAQTRRRHPYCRARIYSDLGFLTSCIKQIDAGQIGVKSLFGKVEDDVLYSGLNFVSIHWWMLSTIDVKTQNYTMSGVHDEGEKGGDDAIRVLTADGLEVVIDLTASIQGGGGRCAAACKRNRVLITKTKLFVR